MKLTGTMKQMLNLAEVVGDINSVGMDYNWLGMMDRINLKGVTLDGRKFELTLEIMNKQEEEKDA